MRVPSSSDDPYQVLPTVKLHSPKLIKILKVVCIAVLSVASMIGVGYARYNYWYLGQVNPSGDASGESIFRVLATDDLVTLSKRLKQEGFIVNDSVFRDYSKDKGGLEIIPGFYTLKPHDHMGNLLRVLRTPPNETLTKVTFPEGFTVQQIAQRLSAKVQSIDSKKFLSAAGESQVSNSLVRSAYQSDSVQSLEGLLFPDTYLVTGDETPAQVLQKMVRLMERVGRQEGLDDSLVKVGRTPYEVLIIASIIEREAKIPADRSKISRVIYNRLALGMPLEIDATLLYHQSPETPFSVLKELDTPYNSYLHSGLPPTPISNPGRASIAAALAPVANPSAGNPLCRDIPASTPCLYLYYVLYDKDGRHVFAATATQHEANVQAAIAAGVL